MEGTQRPKSQPLDLDLCMSVGMVQQISRDPLQWRFQDDYNQIWDHEDPADNHTRCTREESKFTTTSGPSPYLFSARWPSISAADASLPQSNSYLFEGLYDLIDRYHTHTTTSIYRLTSQIEASDLKRSKEYLGMSREIRLLGKRMDLNGNLMTRHPRITNVWR